jgi:hypothetical protein
VLVSINANLRFQKFLAFQPKNKRKKEITPKALREARIFKITNIKPNPPLKTKTFCTPNYILHKREIVDFFSQSYRAS